MSHAYQSMQNRANTTMKSDASAIGDANIHPRGTCVSLTHHSFHSSTSHDGMS